MTLATCRGCEVTVHSPCAGELVHSSSYGCATLGCCAPGYRERELPLTWSAWLVETGLSAMSLLLVGAALAALGGGLLLKVVQTLHGGLIPW
jgi:hypothetical protein